MPTCFKLFALVILNLILVEKRMYVCLYTYLSRSTMALCLRVKTHKPYVESRNMLGGVRSLDDCI